MRFAADLHIHSKYSMATSKDLSPENIWEWAQLKGIKVVGTGDAIHPGWLDELLKKLEPHDNGLFGLKKEYETDNVPDSCRTDTFFILTSEISLIYKKNGRVRRVHSIILIPDFSHAEKVQKVLSKIGNIASDGRPILGLDAKQLLAIVMDICPNAMIIPAHIWTPHFSVLGAFSGFDSLEECFEELTPYIFAVETGLSSDPSMNWRLSALDDITLISNSDAHSPSKIGREANIFDTELSYKSITGAIKTKRGFHGTIEFFPEQGKYHYDGHRACNIGFPPSDTIKHGFMCPVCGKELTIGVLHRIETLADRKKGFRPGSALPFASLIPLTEIIGEAINTGPSSKKVALEYKKIVRQLGNELSVLMDLGLDYIENEGFSHISKAISRMRSGSVLIEPGFDGRYGKVKAFHHNEQKNKLVKSP